MRFSPSSPHAHLSSSIGNLGLVICVLAYLALSLAVGSGLAGPPTTPDAAATPLLADDATVQAATWSGVEAFTMLGIGAGIWAFSAIAFAGKRQATLR